MATKIQRYQNTILPFVKSKPKIYSMYNRHSYLVSTMKNFCSHSLLTHSVSVHLASVAQCEILRHDKIMPFGGFNSKLQHTMHVLWPLVLNLSQHLSICMNAPYLCK